MVFHLIQPFTKRFRDIPSVIKVTFFIKQLSIKLISIQYLIGYRVISYIPYEMRKEYLRTRSSLTKFMYVPMQYLALINR